MDEALGEREGRREEMPSVACCFVPGIYRQNRLQLFFFFIDSWGTFYPDSSSLAANGLFYFLCQDLYAYYLCF